MLKYGLSSALLVTCLAAIGLSEAAPASQVRPPARYVTLQMATATVRPMFGGQILGYDVDQNGTTGAFSEFVDEPNGDVLAATETFDQSTGKIVSVVAKTRTQDDFVTEGVVGRRVGLILHQHAGHNRFLTMNPLEANQFNGVWTPPIKTSYQIEGISSDQGTRQSAAYETSFTTFLTFVFGSDVAANTFGPLISLKPIINGDEFFLPKIAFDSRTGRAVLADSQGCPEPVCTTDIALVNLATGKIREFTDHLGVGTVDGVAVDPATGIACTTTLVDQGVEFYDLAKGTGFEVTIPNAGSELDAGLDVEFDPVNHVFIVSQYSSNGNPNDPQPRIYLYDEHGTVLETVPIQRTSVSPSKIAFNPRTRMGFIAEIIEPQHEFLAIQSFKY